MKELIGTEKQIAWASKIRDDMIRWYDLALAELDEDIADEDNPEEDIAELKERREQIVAGFSKIVETVDSASWWIDNRVADPTKLYTGFYKPQYLSTIQQFIKRGVRAIKA